MTFDPTYLRARVAIYAPAQNVKLRAHMRIHAQCSVHVGGVVVDLNQGARGKLFEHRYCTSVCTPFTIPQLVNINMTENCQTRSMPPGYISPNVTPKCTWAANKTQAESPHASLPPRYMQDDVLTQRMMRLIRPCWHSLFTVVLYINVCDCSTACVSMDTEVSVDM